MKTLKYFMGALALCSMVFVSCGPRDPEPPIVNPNDTTQTQKPSGDMPEVAATEGAVTVVWHIVDAEVCSGLVFAGDYNGYNTEVANMAKFEKIEGYEGWYKAVITPADASLTPVLQGKPCALAEDGTFPSSWDYQWFASADGVEVAILSGEAELLPEYNGEMKLAVTNNSSVVYVESHAFKANPCVPPTYEEVTFTVKTTVPVIGATEATVYIVGGAFEKSWDATAYPMTKINDSEWTITLPALINQEYKYVVNADWANDLALAPEEGAECSKTSGNLKLEFTLVEDEVYGFINFGATKCEETPAE